MKKMLLFSLLLSSMVPAARSQTGVSSPLMHKTDSLITDFMQTYGINGGTVSITKGGKLIYNRGFGYADMNSTELTRPYHLFRIASNSKAITGIAIMKLVQDGQLNLTDTVFGAGRILDQSYYLSAIADTRINNITVKQLLEHTAGWDRSVSCDNQSGCDPIGFPLHVTSVLGEANPVGDTALIKFLITKGLNFTPGTAYAYSNIGYLVLAEVIEKKTGMAYIDYVTSIIMEPLGLCDMHIGRNLLANKQEREVEYNSPYTTLSAYGTSQYVPWQYGGWNLEAMHAHGGWISTSEDYVRMILAVDGMTTVPDILTPASITTMTTPSSVNAGYAKGWSVNSFGNWWHTGSLDGTSAFMARTSGGYTWAFHFNERSSASGFWSDLDDLPWNCIAATTAFPTYDLFAPSVQAKNLNPIKLSSTSAQLTWTAGTGNKHMILARESNTWTAFPVAGTTYTANTVYGSGDDLGNSTFVVYQGPATTVTITGLDPAKTYHFTVMEVKDDASTGSNAVYKYGCRPTASLAMSSGVHSVSSASGVSCYPNPASDKLTLENSNRLLAGTAVIFTDISGRQVMTKTLAYGKQSVDISRLSMGVYFLRLSNGEVMKVTKL